MFTKMIEKIPSYLLTATLYGLFWLLALMVTITIDVYLGLIFLFATPVWIIFTGYRTVKAYKTENDCKCGEIEND